MKTVIAAPILFVTVLAIASSNVLLVSSATAEAKHHRAHLHGVADLTMVVEGNHLRIEFSSPAVSILGFEHKASNPTQLAAVADAEKKLGNTQSLFTFTGTQCDLRSTSINMSSLLDTASAGEGSHNRHKELKADKNSEEAHTNISALYNYNCADGEKLKFLRVGT